MNSEAKPPLQHVALRSYCGVRVVGDNGTVISGALACISFAWDGVRVLVDSDTLVARARRMIFFFYRN